VQVTPLDPAVLSDPELLSRVHRAERPALGALYQRHAARMIACARRLLDEHREAEDVVQEVFLEVWQRAGDYDPERGTVRAWLMVRTRSRALDRCRMRQRSRTVPFDAAEDERPSNSPPPESLAVRGAVARLPAELRTVVELGYLAGMSASEMAAYVGLPIGTVKSRVARALARLRTAIAGEGLP
jgi:RNA polymerase sigma-70 factor, ECF subfamily